MATKRPGALDAMMQAAASKKAQRAASKEPSAPAPEPQHRTVNVPQPTMPPPQARYVTSAIHFRMDQYDRLHALARKRVEGTRSKPSASALIVELIDRFLSVLEQDTEKEARAKRHR